MTGPRYEQSFDRASAKKAGYSDDEIDAYLSQKAETADPFKPTMARTPTDATRVVNDKPNGEVYWNDPIQLARAAGQGATLGFADELEAGVRAPFSDKDYGELVSGIRGKNKAYSAEHPVANLLAQMAGGVVTGGAITKAAGGIPKVAEGASTGRKIWESTKAGAKVGAVAGTAAGAGNGETVGGRLKGAAAGAGAGFLFGGALGAGVEAASNAKAVVPWVKELLGKTTGDDAKRAAMGKLVTDMERAGLSPEQIRQQLGEVPVDVPYTIMDVGGRNVRDRGAAVAAVPGRGKETVGAALGARRGAEGGRVVDAFKAATGAEPAEMNTTIAAMKHARGQAADAQYGAAREAGKALLKPEYAELLESPTIRKVYGELTDQLAEAGKELQPLYKPTQIFTTSGAEDATMVMDTPNVETLDYLYRHLRDKAKSAFKADKSAAGRQYRELANKVKGLLDDPELGVPEYTAARRNFAKASGDIDARETGYGFGKMQPEEINATMQGMDDGAQTQARAGYVRDRYEKVAQRGPRTAISKVDGNEQMRAQNMAVAGEGTPRAAELATRLDAEKVMHDTHNRVLVGSRTTPLKEGIEDLGASQWDKAGDALEIATSAPNKTTLVKWAKDALKNRALTGRGEIAEQLGDLLVKGTASRQDLTDLIDALAGFQQSKALIPASTRQVGPTRAAALAGYGTSRVERNQ